MKRLRHIQTSQITISSVSSMRWTVVVVLILLITSYVLAESDRNASDSDETEKAVSRDELNQNISILEASAEVETENAMNSAAHLDARPKAGGSSSSRRAATVKPMAAKRPVIRARDSAKLPTKNLKGSFKSSLLDRVDSGKSKPAKSVRTSGAKTSAKISKSAKAKSKQPKTKSKQPKRSNGKSLERSGETADGGAAAPPAAADLVSAQPPSAADETAVQVPAVENGATELVAPLESTPSDTPVDQPQAVVEPSSENPETFSPQTAPVAQTEQPVHPVVRRVVQRRPAAGPIHRVRRVVRRRPAAASGRVRRVRRIRRVVRRRPAAAGRVHRVRRVVRRRPAAGRVRRVVRRRRPAAAAGRVRQVRRIHRRATTPTPVDKVAESDAAKPSAVDFKTSTKATSDGITITTEAHLSPRKESKVVSKRAAQPKPERRIRRVIRRAPKPQRRIRRVIRRVPQPHRRIRRVVPQPQRRIRRVVRQPQRVRSVGRVVRHQQQTQSAHLATGNRGTGSASAPQRTRHAPRRIHRIGHQASSTKAGAAIAHTQSARPISSGKGKSTASGVPAASRRAVASRVLKQSQPQSAAAKPRPVSTKTVAKAATKKALNNKVATRPAAGKSAGGDKIVTLDEIDKNKYRL